MTLLSLGPSIQGAADKVTCSNTAQRMWERILESQGKHNPQYRLESADLLHKDILYMKCLKLSCGKVNLLVSQNECCYCMRLFH